MTIVHLFVRVHFLVILLLVIKLLLTLTQLIGIQLGWEPLYLCEYPSAFQLPLADNVAYQVYSQRTFTSFSPGFKD